MPGFFPAIISRHPEADIPLAGVRSHLVGAGDQQFIFMEFAADVMVDEHSHEAQWGVVLDGQMELKVEGKARILKKGDSYHLPAGVVHSARILAGYKDLTLFDQPDRYRLKP